MSSGSFWQVLHFSSQSHDDFCLRINVRNAVREVFGTKAGCMLWSSCSIYTEVSLTKGSSRRKLIKLRKPCDSAIV